MRQQQTGAPLTLFYSYAREDEPLREQLEKHLHLLRRQGFISEWYDRQIVAGTEWAQEIDAHLETASIILLLISADFLASDYCYDIEMQRALGRHKRGEAHVIPIFLRPVDWQNAPFAYLQGLPRNGLPVTAWPDRDEAFADIAQGLRRVLVRLQPTSTPSSFSTMERQNRARMLKRVRTIWVEGVLAHSLHQAAILTLDLQEQPDALHNPFRLQVQETELPPRSLPARTPLIQVYDEADGEVLILGEPGAGKTTLLLELARSLLDRAIADEHHPLPVVFPLSSWALKRLPLEAWLIEELETKYQLPKHIAQYWIGTNQVLPLLDGLDEVVAPARSACLEAITTYHQCHPDVPLVLSSRREEYFAQPFRVQLQKAVLVQPLAREQIEEYLQAALGKLEGIGHLLERDEGLQQLATTPLMLSILTLAYQGTSPNELSQAASQEEWRRQIFDAYVKRMLARRGILRAGTPQQFMHWLTYLAARMREHNQTVFLVEDLQPDWLSPKQQRLYRWNLKLVFGWLGGLVFGLVFGLSSGLLNGLIFGLSTGLIFSLLGRPIFWWLDWRVSKGDASKIRPAEVINWSWKKVRMSLRTRLIYLMIILTLSLVIRRLGGGFALEAAIQFTALQIWLTAGLFAGLSTDQLTDRVGFSPNEGIRRSGKYGLLVALVSWLFIALLSLPYEWLFYGFIPGLVFSLQSGLLIALLTGLFTGWNAFLRHFVLRMTLSSTKHLPWNVVFFLDEAATRLLLHKVGGGYIFIHRLLLDYFADLEKDDI